MRLTRKFIPDLYVKSIYEIPYHDFKKQGITTLFFDLDNTLIGYDEDILPEDVIAFLNTLTSDFKIMVLSNSGYKRVQKAIQTTFPFIHLMFKPFKRGFKKALRKSHSKPHEVLVIGDQLMTDVFGAHRMKMQVCLVKSVRRSSDRWMTKINRWLERRMLNRIRRKDPKLYEERLEVYVNDHAL
ncbi:MAG: YqeG family HAD IIIA-type phosphatase [Acholeplasmataceae bacterium]|nr:YqeG family HAD IIIA-type phosphatase [Acholeplasmataceae bacterium]